MSREKDDSEYDSDDEELKKIQMKRFPKSIGSSSSSAIQPLSSPVATGNINPKQLGIIPPDDLKNMTQMFMKTKNGNCIAEIDVINYLYSGYNINDELRKPYNERSNMYKKNIECLDKLAVPLKDLLPNTYKSKYVILYRYSTKKFEEGKSQGFMSTSNKPITWFGSHGMKIYVPITTKVLLLDISSHMRIGSKDSEIKDYYEIILPRGTILTLLDDDDNPLDKNYSSYVVYGTSENVMNEIMDDINK